MLVTVHEEACCSRLRGMAQGGDVGCLLDSKEKFVLSKVLCPVGLLNGVSWSLLYRREPSVGCQAGENLSAGDFCKEARFVGRVYEHRILQRTFEKDCFHWCGLWRWSTARIAAYKEYLSGIFQIRYSWR